MPEHLTIPLSTASGWHSWNSLSVTFCYLSPLSLYNYSLGDMSPVQLCKLRCPWAQGEKFRSLLVSVLENVVLLLFFPRADISSTSPQFHCQTLYFLTFLCPASMVPLKERFEGYTVKKVMGNRLAFTDPLCKEAWMSLPSCPPPPGGSLPQETSEGPPAGRDPAGTQCFRNAGF